MIIIHKNYGTYIPYNLTGNNLTLNDELIIKLDKYERDEPSHIDICRDKFGNIVMGVIPGVAELYAAQIDIPARAYEGVEITDEDDPDEDNGQTWTRTPIAFDPANVTLTLWGLDGVYAAPDEPDEPEEPEENENAEL